MADPGLTEVDRFDVTVIPDKLSQAIFWSDA